MEELNKTQLVLLMLFVSFVTSIATGIVTVTLLERAPKSVTQTINRVVERTIEKVVPGPGEMKTINTTKEVVVSEDDLIIRAVTKTTPSIVRVRIPGSAISQATTTPLPIAALGNLTEPAYEPDTFLTGLFISDTGRIIVSPAGLISQSESTRNFSVLMNGTTTERTAVLVGVSDDLTVAVLQLKLAVGEKIPAVSLPVARPALGQTLVLLDLTEGTSPSVIVGRVNNISVPANASSSPVVTTNIDTNPRIIADPLIDTNGSFAGFLARGGRVTPTETIKMAMEKVISASIDKTPKGQ